MLRNIRFLSIPALLVLTGSCEKPAGPGGSSSIQGQIIEKTYDRGFRVLQTEIPLADEDVFIKYGDSKTPSDDRKTSPEGYFEFKYLSKGDYKVFVYSEDNTGNSESGMISLESPVNISSNDQVVDLGQITVYNSMDVNDGKATITGQVLRINYSKGFIYILDTLAAQNYDVFLIYEDDLHYTDRIRTLYDGTFAFPDLIKGNYSVYILADDILGGTEEIPVKKFIHVNALSGVFDAGILYRPVED
jgi:hypothetical protein